ncbi:hypothetical protein [uncultured Aliiroseovarius sp.]|uniref:hypothetical protein n=1 Tax=uncultured Aliiroseovarius sp. TaxID=1658783 RepID=UPI002591DC76|nr:hypothetical protein [uncultured Aliiroseovarius sp.]
MRDRFGTREIAGHREAPRPFQGRDFIDLAGMFNHRFYLCRSPGRRCFSSFSALAGFIPRAPWNIEADGDRIAGRKALSQGFIEQGLHCPPFILSGRGRPDPRLVAGQHFAPIICGDLDLVVLRKECQADLPCGPVAL